MTVLARKNLLALAAVVIVIFAAFLLLRNNNNNPTPSQQSPVQKSRSGPVVGRMGEGYFNFEIADSSAERTLGLSGRDPLPETDSLLFVFEQPDQHCFWMKDMKFAIDILWFDENKKLIYEKRNVSPDTYPQNFCPPTPALYVAEVTAGVAEKNQIKLGDTLDVEL